MVALRQKILSLPTAYARRITSISDPKQASAILKEMAYSLLDDIHDLPRRARGLMLSTWP
jgi:hypothetical protein